MDRLRNTLVTVTRKKIISNEPTPSKLVRCLSTADLTFVGIGCMLGSGVYILTGEVAAEVAGPAAMVSFFIAGIVSLFSALCYTECATRYPETGASYLYVYVTMGELSGFVIGWNSIILRIMGVSFVSRGWSAYFDNAIGARISNFTVDVLLEGTVWETPFMSPYPDLIAGVVSLLACVLVVVGTELSAKASSFFVLTNIVTIIMVIIVAFVYADYSNMTHHGGFAPMGIEGVITGAAASFSGYCGFEAIAFAAEEAKNPKKGLPISIGISFGVAILCYMGGVFAITVLADWQEINSASPFVSAFRAVGANWMSIVVAIGALCSITGGVIACTFCFARAIFVMGRDGLIPAIFAQTGSSSHTPTVATIFGGTLSIIVSVFVNFVTLIEFISLVIFVEFISVSVSCILLRYNPAGCRQRRESTNIRRREQESNQKLSTHQSPQKANADISFADGHDQHYNNDVEQRPLSIPSTSLNEGPSESNNSGLNDTAVITQHEQDTNGHGSNRYNSINEHTSRHACNRCTSINEHTPLLTSQVGFVNNSRQTWSLIKLWIKENPVSVVLICLLEFIVNVYGAVWIISYKMDQIKSGDGFVIFLLVLTAVLAVAGCIPLCMLKQYSDGISFQVPLMPFIPIASIVFNIILMMRLELFTWIELGVWITIGIIVYFSYGIRHSRETMGGGYGYLTRGPSCINA